MTRNAFDDVRLVDGETLAEMLERVDRLVGDELADGELERRLAEAKRQADGEPDVGPQVPSPRKAPDQERPAVPSRVVRVAGAIVVAALLSTFFYRVADDGVAPHDTPGAVVELPGPRATLDKSTPAPIRGRTVDPPVPALALPGATPTRKKKTSGPTAAVRYGSGRELPGGGPPPAESPLAATARATSPPAVLSEPTGAATPSAAVSPTVEPSVAAASPAVFPVRKRRSDVQWQVSPGDAIDLGSWRLGADVSSHDILIQSLPGAGGLGMTPGPGSQVISLTRPVSAVDCLDSPPDGSTAGPTRLTTGQSYCLRSPADGHDDHRNVAVMTVLDTAEDLATVRVKRWEVSD